MYTYIYIYTDINIHVEENMDGGLQSYSEFNKNIYIYIVSIVKIFLLRDLGILEVLDI